jgi:tetratricopeptide (TPR) repeat protein
LTLFDLGQPGEAIKELEKVVKSGEKRAEVYLSLGAAYLEAGRLDEGLEILSQATHIDPARPDIRIQLARAYRLKGVLDQADAQLKIAVPQGHTSVASPFVQQRQLEFDLYTEQGLLKLQLGQLEAAARAFRKVLEMDPNHGPTNRSLAEVYLRQGNYARALEYAARAEKLGFPLSDDKRKLLQERLKSQKKDAGGRE